MKALVFATLDTVLIADLTQELTGAELRCSASPYFMTAAPVFHDCLCWIEKQLKSEIVAKWPIVSRLSYAMRQLDDNPNRGANRAIELWPQHEYSCDETGACTSSIMVRYPVKDAQNRWKL